MQSPRTLASTGNSHLPTVPTAVIGKCGKLRVPLYLLANTVKKWGTGNTFRMEDVRNVFIEPVFADWAARNIL
jgi:hypothetical protein